MKFHLSAASGNAFTGVGEGYIRIGPTEYRENVAVTANDVITGWTSRGFDSLAPDDFARLASKKPEIVILGTGKTLAFPRPSVTRALIEAGIGFEVMDTAAACRTFNILSAEGRNVLAAIIVDA